MEEKKTTRKRATKSPVKKTTKTAPKKSKDESFVETVSVESLTVSETTTQKTPGQKINVFPLIFVLMVVTLGLLGYLFKDRIFAATVNGKPIFRYELNLRMTKTYGKEMLENLIVEKLIEEEASKNGVTVSENEIDDEINKISESLGTDTNLEDILAFQGMTIADLKEQLRLKVQVNKILINEVSVSDEEIEDLIKNNPEVLVATDEAEKKEEARGFIMEQKINQSFAVWIDELINNSKITRFLN